MKLSQYMLMKLSEECAEVAHRASKQIQFGPEQAQKGHTETNKQRLKGELLDLLAVSRVLVSLDQIDPLSDQEQNDAFYAKIAKMDKYLQISKELGEITIDD